MLMRMLAGGVAAGIGAGLLAAALHFMFIQSPLLLAESYEGGELVHFTDGSDAAHTAEGTHTGDAGHADNGTAQGHDHGAHDHGGAAEVSTFTRNSFTVLFTSLIYVGYGLFLMAAFQVAEALGRPVTRAQGVIWGLCGFAAFQLAPAMGLAPELPGTIAAELQARQVWWLGTVVATAVGLAAIGLGRTPVLVGVGAVLILAPHIIGAPHPDAFYGVAPPELGAEFAARSLGVGLAAWALLGWLGARNWAAGAA